MKTRLIIAMFTMLLSSFSTQAKVDVNVAAKAMKIAKAVAATLDVGAHEKCLGEGSAADYLVPFGGEARGNEILLNLSFGPKENPSECGDPHYSLDLVFDAEGNFLQASVIEI